MVSIPEHQLVLQALHDLQQYHQWVCYIFVSRGEKITKPPINPHMTEFPARKERLADINDSKTWASYETALARWKASRSYKGIGFVFTSQDPFCGIDLDHCIDSTTGKIAPWAQRIIKLLNSYSEVSPTGTGIHIFVRAKLDETLAAIGITDQGIKHKKGNIELYDSDRYFTWSGKHLRGTPTGIEDRQDQINELYFELFCIEEEEISPTPTSAPTSLKTPLALPQGDQALIELAETARGRNGWLFSQLWRGNLSGYTKRGSNEIDYSQADLALCSILAYWTQKDAARIDRLFRQSALYSPTERKEKWDRPARSGETYGQGTIRVAITRCFRVYDPTWRPPGWIGTSQELQNQRTTSHQLLRKQSFSQKEHASLQEQEKKRRNA